MIPKNRIYGKRSIGAEAEWSAVVLRLKSSVFLSQVTHLAVNIVGDSLLAHGESNGSLCGVLADAGVGLGHGGHGEDEVRVGLIECCV